ncbi:hypothetical protein Q9233_007219 [Columba guinea]|nr:hypothetical protein Q9233_007219 [Columba guinea]
MEEPTGSRSPAGYAARKVACDPLVSSDTAYKGNIVPQFLKLRNWHLKENIEEDYPYHPWASQLWQQRWHSPLDAGICERNMKSLMLTIYSTDKYWIISFTLVHLG